MKTEKYLNMSILAGLCFILFMGSAYATRDLMTGFEEKYPDIKDHPPYLGCLACHTSVGSIVNSNVELNLYGEDFFMEWDGEEEGISLALETIESRDSDSDNFTNLMEIIEHTNPGNESEKPQPDLSEVINKLLLVIENDELASIFRVIAIKKLFNLNFVATRYGPSVITLLEIMRDGEDVDVRVEIINGFATLRPIVLRVVMVTASLVNTENSQMKAALLSYFRSEGIRELAANDSIVKRVVESSLKSLESEEEE